MIIESFQRTGSSYIKHPAQNTQDQMALQNLCEDCQENAEKMQGFKTGHFERFTCDKKYPTQLW